jgi:hypothetical protein
MQCRLPEANAAGGNTEGKRMTNFPIHPKHPERICWGCDKYCPADDLRCGNGTIRTEHPVELFGEDWFEWLMEKESATAERIGGPREQLLDRPRGRGT